MARLADIDNRKAITLYAYQHHLDKPLVEPVDGLKPVVLNDQQVLAFLDLASNGSWQQVFEQDLQCVSQTDKGEALLSVDVPLVTFRERFCCSLLDNMSETHRNLQEYLRVCTRDWRSAGADLVLVDGFLRQDLS